MADRVESAPADRATAAARPACVGALELIVGPMFSGKSTELLRRVRRHRYGRRNILIVKHAADTRYSRSAVVVTHDHVTETSVCVDRLGHLDDAAWGAADVIAIDEGQFMPDLQEFCRRACARGKLVLVAALDGTYTREPFGSVCALVPFAERVDKLCAVCGVCGRDAPFTRRLTRDTSVIVVGSDDMYVPVCRACYDMPLARVQQRVQHNGAVGSPAPQSAEHAAAVQGGTSRE